MTVVDLAIHPKAHSKAHPEAELGRAMPPRAGSARGRAFPIVIVGHVDHGKSTLVGRLLHDTDSLPDGKLEQIKAVSAKRGLDFEWSFLLDALQVERDQGITVDTTQIWFTTERRRYVIIDAPGHKEFLKNMVTGAAQADAAILVVDAAQGLAEQTRRHAYLLHLLGIRQVAVAINKIDLIGHSETRFHAVAEAVRGYLADIGIEAAALVPVSARQGDNIAERSPSTAWYQGPTLIGALDTFAPRAVAIDQPLRLPVQDLYRLDDRRVVVGRIESGRLKVGDRLRFAPLGREAVVASLEAWRGSAADHAPREEAIAGESVAFTLNEEVFVERGALASAPDQRPREANRLTVRLFWLDREPLKPGDRLSLKIGTAESEVEVETITEVLDVESLGATDAAQVERNGVARAVLKSRKPLALDLYDALPRTGRGVLIRGPQIAGGLVIEQAIAAANDVVAVASSVTAEERARMNGHRGGVLWFTGLSGAGKSTLAMALQRTLFARGRQAVVLDGDNLRHGLNRDLGFSAEDRTENIRRIAEVAKLMAETGQIVIVSAISPLRMHRDLARSIIAADFHEIHVHADLATCESRDPKGLYKRARAGKIPEFTGISAPYEVPAQPQLAVDTAWLSLQQASEILIDYAMRSFSA
ncbi:MAG TPA: adenylyl-sulfate kinase [Ferrovibrio sp.]|jgi:bifunctional enzyme CysN/CysC|uniref:adenylyl-sulfate kinase n=1 Tax=Ferrovibrio sp. TaxID=1917215 RepID=UPI002ED2BDBA